MSSCASGSADDSLNDTDQATHARLAAIEGHLRHIETLLIGISQFRDRLDQIHATLELAIGFLAPDSDSSGVSADSSPALASAATGANFRVVAHVSRDGHGAQLVPDVVWPDMWSVRLFVTGLLRNMARSGLPSLGCRCWCEVWIPDENGVLADSAFLDPESSAIDWESDLRDGGNDS